MAAHGAVGIRVAGVFMLAASRFLPAHGACLPVLVGAFLPRAPRMARGSGVGVHVGIAAAVAGMGGEALFGAGGRRHDVPVGVPKGRANLRACIGGRTAGMVAGGGFGAVLRAGGVVVGNVVRKAVRALRRGDDVAAHAADHGLGAVSPALRLMGGIAVLLHVVGHGTMGVEAFMPVTRGGALPRTVPVVAGGGQEDGARIRIGQPVKGRARGVVGPAVVDAVGVRGLGGNGGGGRIGMARVAHAGEACGGAGIVGAPCPGGQLPVVPQRGHNHVRQLHGRRSVGKVALAHRAAPVLHVSILGAGGGHGGMLRQAVGAETAVFQLAGVAHLFVQAIVRGAARMRAARVCRLADRAGFVVVLPVRLPLAGVRHKHGHQRVLRGRGEGVAGVVADGLSVFLPAREMRRFRVDRGGDRHGIAVFHRAAAAYRAVALRAHGDLKFRGVDGEGGLAAVHHLIGAGHHAAVHPVVHLQRGFGGGVGSPVHAGAVLHVLPACAVVHLPLITHRALRRHGEAGRRALHGRGVGRLGGHRQLCAQRKGLHRAGHGFAGIVDDSVVALPHQRAAHPGDALLAGRGEAVGAHGQLERALAVHGAAAQVDGHGVDVRACRDFQHRGVVAVVLIILVVSLIRIVGSPIVRGIARGIL